MRPIVMYDLETGGLNWWPNTENPSGQTFPMHPIIQIAAVACDLDDDWKFIDKFEMKVRFDINACSPAALEINNYDPIIWEKEAGSPAVAMLAFSTFLKRFCFVKKISKKGHPYYVAMTGGHNIGGFDKPFLWAWYKSYGAFLPADYHVVDTMQMAINYELALGKKVFENYKLETLCSYFDIARPAETEHDALADVKQTALVGKTISSLMTAKEWK